MDARCLNCSAMAIMRNQRGMKLSDYNCKCGGKYERVNGTGKIYGESPYEEFSPTVTPYESWTDQRKYYATYQNSRGQHFVPDFKNKKWIHIENP